MPECDLKVQGPTIKAPNLIHDNTISFLYYETKATHCSSGRLPVHLAGVGRHAGRGRHAGSGRTAGVGRPAEGNTDMSLKRRITVLLLLVYIRVGLYKLLVLVYIYRCIYVVCTVYTVGLTDNTPCTFH